MTLDNQAGAKMNTKSLLKNSKKELEKGSSLVIALLVMALLMGFVALVLTRTVNETRAASNESMESKSFAAAQAGLENSTRDFATVIENNFTPNSSDITTIESSITPGFDDFDFLKRVTQTKAAEQVTLQAGEFQGLYSLRDEWQIDVTATDKKTEVETQLRRRFYNNRIPIFQFGAFYNDDLELNRPPLFTFGGKVHTNGNLFISAYPLSSGAGIFFKSKVTVSGEVVNDKWKTGTTLANPWDNNGDVYIPNATNVNQKLNVGSGSVVCNGSGNALVSPTSRAFPYPQCTQNPSWTSFSQIFEGNLQARVRKLKLPVDRLNIDLVEMVKRGKNIGDKANINGSVADVTPATQDSPVVAKEKFANKAGIRISLADSKNKLPQCGTVSGACGVRLDGDLGNSYGYDPLTMLDGYKATPLNANRLKVSGREVWIKVELVNFDNDLGVPITKDVTQEILSLGMTEPLPSSSNLKVFGYTTTNDSRSIIKLQRWMIPGPTVPNATSTTYVSNKTVDGNSYNFVIRNRSVPVTSTVLTCITLNTCGTAQDAFAATYRNGGTTSGTSDERMHYKLATFNNDFVNQANRYFIVPFPIKMFDTREGSRGDNSSGLSTNNVYRNGVMSLIDIDVANLRRFLNGEFNNLFPNTTPFAAANSGNGLKNTDVPQSRGWVMFFSDRRGDDDFDGKYDMEDVNPNTNSVVDEDIDNDGNITVDYDEAPNPVDSGIDIGYAAVTDQAYYRRGVRLINGTTVPGNYNSAAEQNTQGFTFSSENGTYVFGNYNTTGVNRTGLGSSEVTPAERYLPLNSNLHIPAAVIADAVTILSNAWNDGKSFAYPFTPANRVASDTQLRFGLIAGDSLTASPSPTPSAGTFEGLNGGIHNFKRFLEVWDNKRLNHTGSIINLFNSQTNNGRWKCCNTVYRPPIRDWTFESSYTDPDRLPPGSPFVYYLSFTGFQRVND